MMAVYDHRAPVCLRDLSGQSDAGVAPQVNGPTGVLRSPVVGEPSCW